MDLTEPTLCVQKRGLTSPEEVQDAVRRCIAAKRAAKANVPPIGGIQKASPSPAPPAQQTQQMQQQQQQQETMAVVAPLAVEEERDPLAVAPVTTLASMATASSKGIMDAVRSKTSRLNKDEVAAIGCHTERLCAVVQHLTLRLIEAENRARAAPPTSLAGGILAQQQQQRQSYAGALKLSQRADLVPIRGATGPAIAIYPAEGATTTLKTAEDTKAALKKAIDPAKIGVNIDRLRKVGNAGVVVQTTSVAAAGRLREAVPATMRVTESKKRQPMVCLSAVEGDPGYEAVIEALYEQNFKENAQWPLERVKKEMKGAFKKRRQGGAACAVIFECSAALRETLVSRGRAYIGWQAVEVTDFVDVTCCRKCQQYGHPERYCRATEATCGKCGGAHGTEDCKSATQCCATCKKFGRGDAKSHRTASRECPARQHAEQRAIVSTNYGGH